jgi:Terminase large subunit, T4likevirus-type, N-terminal
MNILQAISDPKVFGPAFRNRASWEAWFSFLAALFGLPMDSEQHRIFKECTQRSDRPTKQAQEAWLVCGRRSGKSFCLALICVFLAAFRDWTPYLGIGERGTVMVIAADRKQARVIMRYVKGLLHSVPMLKRLIQAERVESIDLKNRITIEVHTASFRTVRGYSIVAALLDELAFWPVDENSSSPDFEVVNAIRPAMSTIPDAMLLCASSPYARKGALWESYHRYFGKESPILVWQAPTRTMNPTVPQSYIDSEYEKDPISAESEFGGIFRTDIESFVSREAVEACVEWGVHERGYLDGIRYVAFVDPAGGSGGDSFTLAITHKEGEFAVLDLIREVRAPFSPEGVVAEFSDILKIYKITKVDGDRYAGEWPREQFRKRGIRYEPSKDPKGMLYLNVLPLLNSAKVRLLGEKRLVSQFVGLERNTARGGKDNIDHARGGHDDIANAVAGALLSATAKRSQLRIGTIDVDGRVHWKDEDPERPRVRYVVLTEQEDLRRRGLL